MGGVALRGSGHWFSELWERTIAEAEPRPKLEAFLKASRAEGGAKPLDLDRM